MGEIFGDLAKIVTKLREVKVQVYEPICKWGNSRLFKRSVAE